MTKDYTIITNQTGPHVDLLKRVQRYDQPYQRPISSQQRQLVDNLQKWVEGSGKPVIIDCGCGRGESTVNLAQQHPDHLVIGIDKSAHRLAAASLPGENYRFVRAELIDFLRLIKAANWPVVKQCYFYPNPWPKKNQLKRRWHGHPLAPTIFSLGKAIEVRSNWLIYIEEFLMVAASYGWQGELQTCFNNKPVSAFERKYQQSGTLIFSLTIKLLEKA